MTQSHPKIPTLTRKWLQSDPKVARLARAQPVLDYPWLLWPLQKCFKNQSFFNFSPFRPHQARTCMHDTCITHEIRRRYAQSDPKVTPKCPQSHLHMPTVVPYRSQSQPQVTPKWPQSDPKITPELYKIIISFELDLISAVSNPKGGNRAPSIRIRAK